MNTRLRANRITPRKVSARAILVGAGIAFSAWVILIVAMGALADKSVGCTFCHAMKPYARAQADGAHPTLPCASCHRTEGRLSWLQDGMGLQRMGISELVGRPPAGSSVADTSCRVCHRATLGATVTANAMRISHRELLDRQCTECHGAIAHKLDKRLYGVPEMEACTECHAASPRDPTTCDYCHVPDQKRATTTDKTQWRTTHGPNWEVTHGAGDLSTCVDCHEQSTCVSCHGVPVPHMPTWPKEHGVGLTAPLRKQCLRCHDAAWCNSCHGGVEMPHASAFLKDHGGLAKDSGERRCLKCHTDAGCDECHDRSDHPRQPGLPRQHEGL